MALAFWPASKQAYNAARDSTICGYTEMER